MAKSKVNILKELQNLEEKELKIISKNNAELLAKASAKHNQIVEEINNSKDCGCPSVGLFLLSVLVFYKTVIGLDVKNVKRPSKTLQEQQCHISRKSICGSNISI